MNNYYAYRFYRGNSKFDRDLDYYCIMNIGDTLTLIRQTFNAIVETATLTANRTYTLPDKSGTIALLDDVGGGSSKTVTTITSPTNILVGDNNGVLRCNNTSAIVVTIPASNGYDVGFTVDIIQINTGQVTVTPGSGITLKMFGNSTSAVLIGQNARAQLIKLATNEWHITGDISI